MQPVVYSEKKYAATGIGWHRAGTEIEYKRSKLNRLYSDRPACYMLSFKYNFEYGEDKVYFAYSIPYTFTMLSNFLRQLTNLQTENSVLISGPN